MKYKDWLNEWLDNTVKPTSKIRTYERYKEVADGHIKPKLGNYNLNDLRRPYRKIESGGRRARKSR